MIIGLDVGGTHTDVVLLDETGLLRKVKVPTQPANLLESVQSGLHAVLRDVAPEHLERIVLSTTLTTNAIAEGKLAPVGMIVSSGPGIDPELFRTDRHYYPVSGSIDHRGREIQPIEPSEIETVARQLKQAGIRQVGVASKFSTRNPKHELQIREILKDHFDYIVLGHLVSGSLNFPRRIATAFLNASVYPLHKRFFQAVRRSLADNGLNLPIYILKADGGTMNLEASLEYPGQTILSGPAASVMGCVPYASTTAASLVMDIGGTTTDMAILVQGSPLLAPLGIQLGPYQTLIRSLETLSIGLGGDSAVRVVNGALRLGPDRLGPAMAYGGATPTPTDALFVLGHDRDGDTEAARRGIAGVAGALGLPLEQTAAAIFDLLCREIVQAARRMIDAINSKPVYTIHELLEGYRVTPGELLVLGGPAPFFAARLGELSGIPARVVPECQMANAIGAALARTTCELALFADTERGIATAPEEDFYQPVKADFSRAQAVRMAVDLLRQKAIREGAEPDDLEIEVLEQQQFNMVRSFSTTGRNIRVKVQVKPGLINRYRSVTDSLARTTYAAAAVTNPI